jgi:uridine phosphorylase
MTANDAIVNPVRGNNPPDLGMLSLLIGTTGDINKLCGVMGIDKTQFRPIFISRLYAAESSGPAVSLAGPIVGAPYAVMILETLIAWGAKKILFFGWCGAISPDVKIGDIIIPTAAVIDEGTSKHYQDNDESVSRTSFKMTATIKSILMKSGTPFHEGDIWSTDAIFRETREQVKSYRDQGILAVEMELSALFTVGRFRGIDIAGILVVSDELSTLQWRPGFRADRFEQGRSAACEVINQICQQV